MEPRTGDGASGPLPLHGPPPRPGPPRRARSRPAARSRGARRRPRVALLVETSRSYGRGLLRGIVRYARLHGPWSFYITPGDFEQALPKMEGWGGTGIIARIATPEVARAILATGLPFVALDLSEAQLAPGSRLAQAIEVRSDSRTAARMAFDHLLERGLRRFAFVGIPGRIWSRLREEGFRERVEEEGFECRIYPPPVRKAGREWGREQAIMADWIRALPKPVGLMACNDDRGREVLEACRLAGIQVPDEVAVIGVDDDDLLCELSDPPLSSVALNAERGGFEAAALLDRLMSGKAKGVARRIVVEPTGVVTRRSTDVLAMDDRMVAAALRFIREHAAEPIRIDSLLREVPISRRSLEMKFRRVVGRSLHAEIQRTRLDRAKALLRETDLQIPRVAELSGFGSASYLGLVFHREVGITPSRYRVRVRNR
jgi:LacI family transcriptional regulator